MDAFGFAIGAVLSRWGGGGVLHPIAYESGKFSAAEINYVIYDTELLAIVDSFKVWRRYLEGAFHMGLVYTNHQNLENFMTTKILNRRQAQWAQYLAGINFKLYYGPRWQNGKHDILSPHLELRPSKEECENHPFLTVLYKKNFEQNIIDDLTENNLQNLTIEISRLKEKKWLKYDLEFLKDVKIEGLKDKDYLDAFKSLKEGDSNEMLHEEDGMLFRKSALWVPMSLRISLIRSGYDSKVAGHMGQEMTKELIGRNFSWPKMKKILWSLFGHVKNAKKINQQSTNLKGFYNPSIRTMYDGNLYRLILLSTCLEVRNMINYG
jgi:hypothetical protein